MKAVIFDLDGTIADTSRDLIDGANITLRRMGCGEPLDPVGDMQTAFKGGRAMLRAGLARAGAVADAERLVNEQYPVFLRDYEAVISRYTTLYEGVESALETLSQTGWRLGICTNKPERLARILLSRLDVMHRFGSLVGADTLPVRKPDPEPLLHAVSAAGGKRGQAVFVGDTDTDYHTARAADIPVVMVTFGPHGDDVRRLCPDALLDHFRELPAAATALQTS